MSYDKSKSDIVEVLTNLGFSQAPVNKKVSEDFRPNTFSINKIERVIQMHNHIKSYKFDIEIAFVVNSNDSVDEAQLFFDNIIDKISNIDRFLSYSNNPQIKQTRDIKKIIGSLSFYIDNSYC